LELGNFFHAAKQIGTYLGMIPSEDSSAGKQQRVSILTGEVGTFTLRCVDPSNRLAEMSEKIR